MKLLYRCGHVGEHREGKEPVCAECGCQGIARVVNAQAPRFVGMATGPHVRTQHMDPATPVIGESPLKLRQEKADA